jgi:hypothetical protein
MTDRSTTCPLGGGTAPGSGPGSRPRWWPGDQLIPEPLRVSLPAVVRAELVEGAEQPTIPDQDQAVEALRADRAHEPFRIGVGIRSLDTRQPDSEPAP